ncbi:MAG TPA: response regulator, partial [Rhizomicrobium sp.]
VQPAAGDHADVEDGLILPVVGEIAPKPLPRYAENGRKILLVEDNPINAMLTRELLVRRGYAVSHVPSGESALELAARERFDVVLTDIHMPGMDGVEMAQRLREREGRLGRPCTRIVALTADTVETGRHACQDAGMDGFLTKPVDPAELDAMLNDLIYFAPRSPAEAAA